MKTYPVNKISGPIKLSGAGDDPQWNEAAALSDFSFPWETDAPQKTTFKGLHNESLFYGLFEIDDNHISIFEDKDGKLDVVSSSRAEIFFKADDRLEPYYCLEIDPKCRVLDYEGHYYRNFNFDWSWPDNGLTVKTSMKRTRYTVEFAITKNSLRNLGLLKDNRLQAGLFRADCKLGCNGERVFKWVSWLQPNAKTPDFHIPSAFGILKLEN